jgi:putative autotransporter adhesin-like protein
MKKIVMLIVLMSLIVGCHSGLLHQERGSGNRQKQNRTVAPFTSISTEGAFEIEVVSQKPLSIEVEGDDNILPLIGTDVSGNVLHIKNLRGYSVSTPVVLRISVPNLESISASGAGSFEIEGLKNDKFEIDVNGAPNIRVSGETKLVDIKTNGAGKIDTHRLRAARAVVDSNGVSNVAVYATDQLDVTVTGPSHVTYEGDPVVNKNVNGPGSVTKKPSTVS